MNKLLICAWIFSSTLVLSCKKDIKPPQPEAETKSTATLANVLFRGYLDFKSTVFSERGQTVRALVPITGSRTEKGFRYRVTEYSKKGVVIQYGFILSLEKIPTTIDVYALPINTNGTVLSDKIQRKGNKENIREKIVAKIKINNQTETKGMGEVLSLLPGCENLPQVCIDWYFVSYDLNSGEVIAENYLYTNCYDPCSFSNGGSGNTNTPSCAEMAENLESGPVSEAGGITVGDETSTERTRIYSWYCAKHKFNWWRVKSYETGVHKKMPNGTWNWKELSHTNIAKEGTFAFYSVTASVATSLPTIGVYNSGMQLNLVLSSSVICQGTPISAEWTSSVNSPIWNVNDMGPGIQ